MTSAEPWPALPGVPTLAETLPGYEVLLWFGVAAPAGTPREVVAKLSGEIARIVQSTEVRERLAGQGFEVIGSTPEQFASVLLRELEQWAGVVKEAGIPVE